MQFFESRYQKKHLGKSLNFFALPTTKWLSCKIFERLNGNHLLTANIIKLHKYQTFGLLKMHNMSKIWFTNNKFSLCKDIKYSWFVQKFCLQLTGCRKCYFLIFSFFHFSDFKKLLSKILWQNHPFFIMDFECSYEVLLFLICIFWQWKDGLFEIFTEMHFVSSFLLHKRNITTSLLMIHLKCSIMSV